MPPRRKKEWFDDKRFWRDLYPFMFSEKRFSDTPEQIRKILRLAKPRGKAALDLCCGPGRCSVALAKRGFKVAGVDKSRFLLGKARALARRAKVNIEWVRADMRDFVRPESFDLALSVFTSFGYFDDKSEDLLVLRNIFASLRPGGVLIMDMTAKEWLAKVLQPTTSEVLADGSMLVQRHKIFDGWTRIRNEWIVLRRGRSRRFKFHHTLYTGQELRDRLEQVGFRAIQLFGNFEGGEYGPSASRLVAVARKVEPDGAADARCGQRKG